MYKLLILLFLISCDKTVVQKRLSERTSNYSPNEMESLKRDFYELSTYYDVYYTYLESEVNLTLMNIDQAYECKNGNIIISEDHWNKYKDFEVLHKQNKENLVFGALGACVLLRTVNSNYITIEGYLKTPESLTNLDGVDPFYTIYMCDGEMSQDQCNYDNLALKEAYYHELFTKEIDFFFDEILEYEWD